MIAGIAGSYPSDGTDVHLRLVRRLHECYMYSTYVRVYVSRPCHSRPFHARKHGGKEY